MNHDEIIRQIEGLMTIYEQAATRLAQMDAFDDEFWPVMHELRVIEAKLETLIQVATVPIHKWLAAHDDYLASNNCAA